MRARTAEVGLAQDDGPGVPQALHEGGIARRPVVGVGHVGAGGGPHVEGVVPAPHAPGDAGRSMPSQLRMFCGARYGALIFDGEDHAVQGSGQRARCLQLGVQRRCARRTERAR